MRLWNQALLDKTWMKKTHRYHRHAENEVTIPERMIAIDHGKKDRLVTGMFYKYSLILPLLPQGGRILDACAGAGFGASYLASSGYDVTAMDAELRWAKYRDNITCVEEDIHEFHTNGGGPYDGITFVDAIEHIKGSHQIQALQNMYSLLKPRGWFLIDTPRVRVSGRQSSEHPSCLNWNDLLARFEAMGEWSEYQRYLITFETPIKGETGFTVARRVLGDPPEEIPHGQDQIIIGRKKEES